MINTDSPQTTKTAHIHHSLKQPVSQEALQGTYISVLYYKGYCRVQREEQINKKMIYWCCCNDYRFGKPSRIVNFVVLHK